MCFGSDQPLETPFNNLKINANSPPSGGEFPKLILLSFS